MTKNNSLHLLQENLAGLAESQRWLQRSYTICQKIGIKESYIPEEFDDFEVLTSRFARTCDFIINKVFRSIDKVELEPLKTTIDVINKAHKRGLIDSAQEMREIKILRNEIAHEYANRELQAIFEDVFKFTPTLLAVIDNINKYCDKF